MSEFRKLKEILRKGGITYKLIDRQDPPEGVTDKKGNAIKPVVMYAVYGSPYNSEKITGYEVFKVRIMKGGKINGNDVSPGEKYLSDEDVGRWGLSFHGKDALERAQEYFNELKKEIV